MKHRGTTDSGVALIVVLLAMLVFTVMMLGFYFVTTGEQKIAASDRDNTVAYYGALGALEKMSSDLAAFFVSHTSPKPSQIDALTGPAYRPSIQGVTFPAGGYTIAYTTVGGNLASTAGTIGGNGPLQGLRGIITPFTLTVIATGPNNTEVKMTREVQEVAVPVFQYGIFSDSDLSFFAGPDFGFGGRVHANGNLFLAEDGGALTLNDRVTAYKDIIRKQLSNGLATVAGGNYGTAVNVNIALGGCPTPTCPSCPTATCRALAVTEGSVTGGPGSAANANWPTLSLTTYNGSIRSGKTGAKKLNLALALAGGSPIAMIQRPVTDPPGPYEDPSGAIGSQRFFSQASLRILLSDQSSSIMNLPGIDSSVQPFPLDDSLIHSAPYNLPAADSCHPPLALSPGWPADHDYMSPVNTTLLGGYIKIEMQLNAAPETWRDVTAEILRLGISRDIQSSGTMSPAGCTNLSILHLEEAKPGVTLNTLSATTTATNFVPINLYDPREGEVRDVTPPQMAAPTLATASSGSLAASKTYYYLVTAVTNCCEIPGTEKSQATTSSKKTMNVSWTAYSGATGYRIYRGTSSGAYSGYFSMGAGTTSLSPSDNGVAWPDGGAPPNAGSPPTVTVSLNGVMNIVEVDVHNLQKWFAGNIGSSGSQALNNSGYILYVSDRRTNRDSSGNETGEFGNEDIISPASGTGAPNGTLDAPEDVNGDGVFRTYGATAHPIAVDSSSGSPWPACMPTVATNNPAFTRITASQGQKNSVIVFRHALRLVNGTLGNLPPLAHANCSDHLAGGFSVAAENPIYVQGDYNASVANSFNDTTTLCHVPAAVIGDAVTLLSNSWTDQNGFTYATNLSSRAATDTWYRTAIIGGKGLSFPKPAWGGDDAGTDGGTHNFLRYIENWGGSPQKNLNYLGAMASFAIARQATGIYKCCTMVYSPPTRNYRFDTDFQNISQLPPGTPRFTDVNALSFRQAILATQ